MARFFIHLVLVVLSIPRRIMDLLGLGFHVVKSMTSNQWFPSPNPPLPDVTNALHNLQEKENAAKTKAQGAVQARDEQAVIVRFMLKDLGAYVQSIANAHPAQAEEIIKSAGMKVKKPREFTKPDFEVRQGKVSGEVTLNVRRAARGAAYFWQYSTDQKSWTTLPSTLKTKTAASSLTPGTTYSFRYRTLTKAGEGDWSHIISFIVK